MTVVVRAFPLQSANNPPDPLRVDLVRGNDDLYPVDSWLVLFTRDDELVVTLGLQGVQYLEQHLRRYFETLKDVQTQVERCSSLVEHCVDNMDDQAPIGVEDRHSLLSKSVVPETFYSSRGAKGCVLGTPACDSYYFFDGRANKRPCSIRLFSDCRPRSFSLVVRKFLSIRDWVDGVDSCFSEKY